MPQPRLPTETKRLRGTLRHDLRNSREPVPPPAMPRPPDHLAGFARTVWMRYAPMLHKMGVLSLADALALEHLCETEAECRDLRAVLAKEGRTIRPPLQNTAGTLQTDPDGYPVLGAAKMHPAVAALDAADRRMKGWLSLFGLTPADRSRVHAEPPPAKHDPDAFNDLD